MIDLDKVMEDAIKTFSVLEINSLTDVTTFYGHTKDDVSLFMFRQTWDSTAGGTGGIGGQAITSSYTVVAVSDIVGSAIVYFGAPAYMIRRPNEEFWKDLSSFRMLGKREAPRAKYERK